MTYSIEETIEPKIQSNPSAAAGGGLRLESAYQVIFIL